ncbi:Nmad3 family putative nucleotide modification protein [Paenibacillus polymyxa]|uniref:Nmad3 family putative nucleotide modification protein n=1 Tax=Paenibacillus polymyxa TaxID=1406 RepID=UPI0008FB122C|nr:hypothetical protein [Paenibacillus polymyxa]APB75640.1 hypothetical protein PPYC2_11900 [Paenibacillus polymyxa]POR25525.1 hypothetical protein CG775_21630 [Paenibacillus polymyxa]
MPKVILSRKGFDEKSGGNASVIQDGRLIPFPIPSAESGMYYRDFFFDHGFHFLDVMKNLGINQFSECHLDPDLIRSVLPKRDIDWKPAFGQAGTAEKILRNEKIGKGDIFIFFGWYKNIDRVGNKFKYREGSSKNKGFHSIFGYLEVGQRIDLSSMNVLIPACYAKHPHVYERHRLQKPNSLYISSNQLSFDHTKPGAGAFHFHDDLKLTRAGCTKSKWRLPLLFNELLVNFKANINVEQLHEDSVDLSINGRGSQEVFISSDTRVVRWAQELIRGSVIQI